MPLAKDQLAIVRQMRGQLQDSLLVIGRSILQASNQSLQSIHPKGATIDVEQRLLLLHLGRLLAA